MQRVRQLAGREHARAAAMIGRAVTLPQVGRVVVPDSVPAYLTALYEDGEP